MNKPSGVSSALFLQILPIMRRCRTWLFISAATLVSVGCAAWWLATLARGGPDSYSRLASTSSPHGVGSDVEIRRAPVFNDRTLAAMRDAGINPQDAADGMSHDAAAEWVAGLLSGMNAQGQVDRIEALLRAVEAAGDGFAGMPSGHMRFICAENLARLGRHERAIELFEEVAADGGANSTIRSYALSNVSDSWLKLGQADPAIDAGRRRVEFTKTAPPESFNPTMMDGSQRRQAMWALNQLDMMLFNRAEWRRGATWQAASAEPGTPQQDWAEGVALLEDTVNNYSDELTVSGRVSLLREIASHYNRLEMPDNEVAAYDRLLREHPDYLAESNQVVAVHIDRLQARGFERGDAEYVPLAEAMVRDVANVPSASRIVAHQELARAYRDAGMLENALGEYLLLTDWIVRAEPTFADAGTKHADWILDAARPDSLWNVADIYRELGMHHEAAAAYKEFIERFPDDVNASAGQRLYERSLQSAR